MVPSLKRLLGIILFLLKGGMCMEYDTEKDIILKKLFDNDPDFPSKNIISRRRHYYS